MPLIPAFRRQRQADLNKFEASLVYRASSRIARAAQRNPASEKEEKKEKEKERRVMVRWYLRPAFCHLLLPTLTR